MSLETSIQNLMSRLEAVARDNTTSASALVAEATQGLNALEPPELDELEFKAEPTENTYPVTPKPPTVKTLVAATLPELGALSPFPQKEVPFDATLPKLNLPSFNYSPITANHLQFTASVAQPDPLTVAPTLPVIPGLTPPTLTAPTVVTVDPVSGVVPQVPGPVFQEFTGDFHTAYLEGLAWMAGGVEEWAEWLKKLRGQLAPIEATLIEQLRQVMDGTATALPDTWESQRYDQSRQAVNAERRESLQAIDAAPSTVVGLPVGSRVLARLETELKALQATTQAAGKVTAERREREVKHWQWALSLMGKLVDAALELRSQEAGWKMKGLMVALDGAEATLALALKVLALKEKEVAFFVRYNEAQLRRTELYLAIEKTKLEPLRMAVANNALRIEHNNQVIQAHQLAGSLVQTRIKVFQARIDYMTVSAEWEKLKLKAFEADARRYQAMLKRTATEHEVLRARIKGDLSKAEGELAKVKLYEAKLNAQATEIKAQAATAQAQAAGNKNALEAYTATAETQMAQLKMLGEHAKTALSALSQGNKAAVTEQEMKMRGDELTDHATLSTALRQLRYDQLALSQEVQEYHLELEHATAQSSLLVEGAGVTGGVAKQALASLNGTAAREAKGSA